MKPRRSRLHSRGCEGTHLLAALTQVHFPARSLPRRDNWSGFGADVLIAPEWGGLPRVPWQYAPFVTNLRIDMHPVPGDLNPSPQPRVIVQPPR